MKLNVQEDYEIQEQNEELREKIVEFLNVFFYCVKDFNCEINFKIYLTSIMKFINIINGVDFYPSFV